MFADECGVKLTISRVSLSQVALKKINGKNVFTHTEIRNLESQALRRIFMVVAFSGFIIDFNNKQ